MIASITSSRHVRPSVSPSPADRTAPGTISASTSGARQQLRQAVMLLPFSNSSICPRRIACLLEGEIFSLDIPSHRTSPIAGIAPVLANSGKHCWVHWRWTCPKFLRNRPFMSGRRMPSAPRPGPSPITSSNAPRPNREVRS
jgi:hypothetical protein